MHRVDGLLNAVRRIRNTLDYISSNERIRTGGKDEDIDCKIYQYA